ncbi:MAG: thiamine pyrophosphate-binding protein [Candidatus Rokubacteria bacterium]|nr:thiamine pyrophosphate-binding protein [Candidatus Rokubacteria bacterium]
MSRVTVADVVVDGLQRAGTPRIFGVPGGGSSLDLLEAARRAGMPFVLTHGETAAAIMAAVTGELLDVPGAALVALGPGAARAVDGVAHARLDRAPMVLLTDRHPAAALAFTTHQVIDHRALLAPVTKASVVLEAASAAHWVAHAAQLAMKAPRGPVHLDLAADVAGAAAVPVATSCRPAPLPYPDARALDEAARRLGAASRPVLVVGLDACSDDAAKWVRAVAEALPAPVLVTYKAKGVLPDPHPLALGLITGGVIEERVLGQADLVVAVGFDPVELVPRPWSVAAPVLHLSRAPHESAAYRPAAGVVGDVGAILEELAPRLRDRQRSDWDVAALDRLKRELGGRLAIPVAGLAPHRVVQIARDATPPGTIATCDAGAHMVPVTAFWHAVAPREFLVSNGLATMGFALPAAIAAALAAPDRRVLAFTGDGGLLIAAAEMETAARLGLPIVVIVFDAASLHAGPDWPALARSFGWTAFAAGSEVELSQALETAFTSRGPALIAARIITPWPS